VLHPLYPWFGDDDAWTHGIAHTGFIRAWLDPRFFLVRLALYALTWWWLAHAIRRVGKAKRARHASIALLSQAVTITLASIDLLMSLTPTWTSSGFPL